MSTPGPHDQDLDDHDLRHLRRSFVLARQAVDGGDHAFGAVLAVTTGPERGRVLGEGRNTVVSRRDVTGHAETNVVREVAADTGREVLAGATLYASTEPCAMCAAATFWAGVGRLVYSFPGDALPPLQPDEPVLAVPSRVVLAGTGVRVVGPVLVEEGRAVHAAAA